MDAQRNHDHAQCAQSQLLLTVYVYDAEGTSPVIVAQKIEPACEASELRGVHQRGATRAARRIGRRRHCSANAPVQPSPPVYVCVRAGAVATSSGVAEAAHVTDPVVDDVQGSRDTHAIAISAGPAAVSARLSCSGPSAADATDANPRIVAREAVTEVRGCVRDAMFSR